MEDAATFDGGPKHTPAQGQEAFACPRCGAYANQTWYNVLRQGSGSVQFEDTIHEDGRWSTARCAHCQEYTVWREELLIYPRAATVAMPHTAMPEDAKSLYLEAREVLAISRRAGTALARAALERLLRTLDTEAGRVTLEKRIERISERVPEPLAQMLTVIRVAGNKSLHVEDEPDEVLVLVLDPDSVEVVGLVFAAINDLVEELIAKPAKVAALYDQVPEAIRERVERERKAK